MTNIEFGANLNTSEGIINVKNIALNGRQSKILVTDYRFGSNLLLYSSADILTYGVFDKDVIVFYLEEGQKGQFALQNRGQGESNTYGTSDITTSTSDVVTTVTYTQGVGKTVLELNGVLVYLLEQKAAWKFWAPTTTSNPFVKPDEHIFVLGPYLVRNARTSQGTVFVSGDNDNATEIEVYTGQHSIQAINWNGIRLKTTKTSYGSLVAQIPGTEDREISLPSLTNWRSANSLPEKDTTYDDSKWTTCSKNTTLSPIAPATLPVLFSSDYGYYTGPKIYRGYFDGKSATAVNITCSGGLAFGWTAWLNGGLLGGDVGNASLPTTTAILALPESSLQESNNLITVVVDYNGHDETSTGKGVEDPRGILGAALLPARSEGSGFKLWKVQGNAGGSANIDPIRGPMNEGGFYGERLGWHLPHFDVSSSKFSSSSPLVGLNASGIEFYVTTFRLDLDADLDVPLGISLSAPPNTIARVMIWINGYQYGKFVPHIGPQTRFPIPPGVINNRGSNTLALSLWAMTDDGAMLDNVELFSYGVYQTDFDFNNNWSYLQPVWDKSRLEYA